MSYEEKLQASQAEVTSLGRVSHRIALLDSTERLQQVLEKLLPRLLKRIGDNDSNRTDANQMATIAEGEKRNLTAFYDQIQAKLVEILSHVMNRVRNDMACRLPCESIMELLLQERHKHGPPLLSSHVHPMTTHLTLAFLTLGVPRCDKSELYNLLPSLLACQRVRLDSPAQRSQFHQLAHLLLTCMERLVKESAPRLSIATRSSEQTAVELPAATVSSLALARKLLQEQSQIAGTVFDLLLDVLLYTPTANISSTLPPEGLSQAGNERLRHGASTSERDWAAEMAPRKRRVALKQAVLEWIAPSRKWVLFDGDLARTVALLVVASGSNEVEVAERAESFLKMHLDSLRGQNENVSVSRALLGDPVTFMCQLLSLCLGQAQAEHATIILPSLGSVPNGDLSTQVLLSTKRRPVSEAARAAILAFLASRVLEDDALVFTDTSADSIESISTLAVQVAHTSLSSPAALSVMGLSTLRAKPYSSAAHLLNALCTRLVTITSSAAPNCDKIISLLARMLAAACSVLAPASTQRSTATRTNTTSDGNLEIRDLCYGVICILARSMLAPQAYIFTQGDALSSSVSTATLLFGCAANEQERLRPRAVAALDSLLKSYVRLYSKANDGSVNVPTHSLAENPWAQGTTTEVAGTEPSVATNRSSLLSALLPLIWTAAQSYKPKASRVAAARWASELLIELDITSACHLLCFLAGDSDSTAASIAREGLGLPDLSLASSESDSIVESSLSRLPDFSSLVRQVFHQSYTTTTSSMRCQLYRDFSFRGKAISLHFGMVCLLNDLYGGDEEAIRMYLYALSESLCEFNTGKKKGSAAETVHASDLLDQGSSCLLSLLSASHYARLQVLSANEGGEFTVSFKFLKELTLQANSTRARKYLAGSCGKLLEDSEAWRTSEKWMIDELAQVLSECSEVLSGIEKNHFALSSLHGAAFLGSHAVKAMRSQAESTLHDEGSPMLEDAWKNSADILQALGRGTLHQEELIGNACSDGIAISFYYDGEDAPVLHTRLVLALTSLLTQVSKAVRKFSQSDTINVARCIKAATAAGAALAATTTVASQPNPENAKGAIIWSVRLDCVDSLFELLGSMAFRKEEEVALVAGEALARYADAYCPTDNVWPSEQNVWPIEYNELYSKGLPPHEHVLNTLLRHVFLASSPQKRTSVAPALLAVTARAARGIVSNSAYSCRAFVRSLLTNLDEIQGTFIALLSDPKSKQLCRESCCLGLAACRGVLQSPTVDTDRAAEALNSKLLRAFGQTTNFGGSAMQETQSQAAQRRSELGMDVDSPTTDISDSVAAESEVGGASGIGEAALSAQREMASACVALGRHDILYPLLILSVSHTFWFTADARHRYSATSLLGESSFVGGRTNTEEMRTALRPHLGLLIPRILRAKHDPNGQTRDQMSSLWTGLTGGGAEARQAVSLHLIPTIDALVEETSSKLWRARVGACGALAEIVVGRNWAELGGGGPCLDDDHLYTSETPSASVRLLRLWRASMRAMDDVRLTVRESGATLARAVGRLTVRLCDPATEEQSSPAVGKRGRGVSLTCESASAAAAATSLRWLVRHGLNQHADGSAISMSTLVEIIGLVNAKILEPSLPDLIRSLLVAISGLEPAVFNYLQLRTNDPDGLERARLQAAQHGPIAAAVSKCLELTPGASQEAQNRVVVELDAALRESPGFATRAATADAVARLCSISPGAFKFNRTGSANPTVRLLRAFYYASEHERSSASRDRLIHALGSLAALSPPVNVRSLVLKACEKYTRSTGNSDDPASRITAAASLRSIAVRASNQMTGEYSDVWGRRVLPVAFVGRKDEDPKIAGLWQEVWGEGGAAARTSAGASFGTILEEKLLEYLVQECVAALEEVSWARRISGCKALAELCNLGVLIPLRPSGTIVTEATIARGQRRAKSCQVALEACVFLTRKPRLWDGKIEAVWATCQLTGVWAAALATDRSDFLSQLGPEPTLPVSMSANTLDDLMVGDHWFLEAANQPEEGEEGLANESNASTGTATEDRQLETEDEDLDDWDRQIPQSASSTDARRPISFLGVCHLLVEHAIPALQRDVGDLLLPYRKACFDSLSSLLSNLPPRKSELRLKLKLFELVGSKLVQFMRSEEPPVLKAASLNCMGCLLWNGIGEKADEPSDCSEAVLSVRALAECIAELGGKKQPAWTVREASSQCFAQLVLKMDADCFRQHELISQVVQTASHSLTDRKYWRVRYAGLTLFSCLVQRAGAKDVTAREKIHVVVLEALLPHKEYLLQQIRSCLKDPESKITALASDILSSIAWWP